MKLVIILGALLVSHGNHALETVFKTPKTNGKVLTTGSSASIFTNYEHKDVKFSRKMYTTFSDDVGIPELCNTEGLDVCINWLQPGTNHIKASLKIRSIRDYPSCTEYVSHAEEDQEIKTCYDLEGKYQMYGGRVKNNQRWPSQFNIEDDEPCVTGMAENEGVVEPYWLITDRNGEAITVSPYTALFVTQNETSLCLSSKIQTPYISSGIGTHTLNWTACRADTLPETHLESINVYYPRPRDLPEETVFQYPIWSTWARYKKPINTSSVLDFADQIIQHGFNSSQLEIDDNWETCYGSAKFDEKAFPDPQSMIKTLKDKGFNVTLWTHPFINYNCPEYDTALKNNYLATNANKTNGLTSWWDGVAGLVDFTNEEAAEWWKSRLQNLSSRFNIDAFKFDAGEASYLPGSPDVGPLTGPTRLQPNLYTRQYVRTVASVSEQKRAEVRVVHNNQEEPIFLRMPDKSSTWDIEGGLKSIITNLLAMNIAGYSFVLPDMVGGNGYQGVLPDKELFIRWLQANTFMPTIQFSYVPWDFDDETVEIAKKFTSLHYEYSHKIIELAWKKVSDNTPINLPLWWIDQSEESLTIDTEFLLGDDLLVAPILENNARSRDIYLPSGTWQDELRSGKVYEGSQWLRNYTVELDELAYFTKIN